MRLSQSFGKTLREAPAEAELASHQLLLRANFIRPAGAGIYTFMPLGYRVIRKIWQILAEEMDAIGGQEMWMPNLHPAALWQATGRWGQVDVLFKLKGSGDRDYALSATHEEIVVDLALRDIESYRDLPKMVYHISKKFRDEPRPRGGLIRLREFIMKDAYTLDRDEAALDEYYPSMIQAYFNVFNRCGVPTVAINADVGAMGGKTSQEFTVPHPQGEDVFIACDNCGYAANVEAAEFVREGDKPAQLAELVKVQTPNCKTIADVAAFVGVPTSQTIKAVFYWWRPRYEEKPGEGRLVFALVRGDLNIVDTKLVNALGGGFVRAATEAEIQSIGAVPGYASGIGLTPATGDMNSPGVMIVADESLEYGGNYVVGANEEPYHYTGANVGRDFTVSRMADIAEAGTGHKCPVCGGRIEAKKAIEVGHCFKLGTRYSAAVDATYLDDNGQKQLVYMGSYGIGLDRLMAVVVELHHDDDGIVWPDSVAPYQVHLVHIGKAGDGTKEQAEALYAELTAAGVEVLYDDRDGLGAGVKFTDADLMGIPWRVTLSARSLKGGGVEVKRRSESERQVVAVEELKALLKS
ncbi:Proline--tRNA ligase [Candidatus Promineifilum breve]|uniref:Proline--tRNA ligase n=1 Tax=Candidatus Promineifilum breve TaxID=1806508 RepID=A0A160SZI0_9CHLR|nr:proline--tRNA ligase [Candidatus Promineifilum breve]CUS02991.2 Proline--tRNA ligase [Candidatus Promineifilum breve]